MIDMANPASLATKGHSTLKNALQTTKMVHNTPTWSRQRLTERNDLSRIDQSV
jgi:hypothetical protein